MTEKSKLTIKVHKDKVHGKWVVRINGLPDFRVVAQDNDCMDIIYELDASRFEPAIQYEEALDWIGTITKDLRR